MTPVTPPRWLRVLVHIDFVAAVLLTVLIPLALLVRAILRRREQLPLLLRYWRVSALLMVTVYLLAGRRPHAPAAGIAARLLIAQTLAEPPLVQTQRAASLRHALASADPLLEHWRRLTFAYCLGGAAANLPMLVPQAATLRTAYAEPPLVRPQRAAALRHSLAASLRHSAASATPASPPTPPAPSCSRSCARF